MKNEIKETLSYLTKNAVPFENFGSFVAVSMDGKLFTCAMQANGTAVREEENPEYFDFNEVTAPEREFLKQVNRVFGTTFSENQFSGR